MSGLQSSIRHSNKKKKEKHNRQLSVKIFLEKVDRFMYKFAAIFYFLYVVLMVALFALSKNDWIIAILSAVLFVFSALRLNPKIEKKIGPYVVFITMMLIFGVGICFLILVLKKHVTDNANSEISRWISAITLVGTFVIEHFRSLKKITKQQTETIEKLEKQYIK